ncbi:MAG: TIGR00730 family Rossman fold protein [Phycisphaerales bacterium]
MRSVTVYCSSSGALEPHFAAAARALGHGLADRGLRLVYGGGAVGLMGECARASKERGGQVVGVITEKLLALEQGWTGCDELVVVPTMQQRRRILMDRGDAFIVLPGGLGTYEEFFEVLVARQLDDHRKPIAIVNHEGYYDPLLAMIDHGIEHRFVRVAIRRLLAVVPSASLAIDAVQAQWRAGPPQEDPAQMLPMHAGQDARTPPGGRAP